MQTIIWFMLKGKFNLSIQIHYTFFISKVSPPETFFNKRINKKVFVSKYIIAENFIAELNLLI